MRLPSSAARAQIDKIYPETVYMPVRFLCHRRSKFISPSSMLEISTARIAAMVDTEPGLHPPQPTWLVEWDGPEDQENSHKWLTEYKLLNTLVLVILPLVVNIGPSIMGGSLASLEKEFYISSKVDILTTLSNFLMVSPLLSSVSRHPKIESQANIRSFSRSACCLKSTGDDGPFSVVSYSSRPSVFRSQWRKTSIPF